MLLGPVPMAWHLICLWQAAPGRPSTLETRRARIRVQAIVRKKVEMSTFLLTNMLRSMVHMDLYLVVTLMKIELVSMSSVMNESTIQQISLLGRVQSKASLPGKVHGAWVGQLRVAQHATRVVSITWLHNGFVTVDTQKMSKSLGNFFTIREVRCFILSRDIRMSIVWNAKRFVLQTLLSLFSTLVEHSWHPYKIVPWVVQLDFLVGSSGLPSTSQLQRRLLPIHFRTPVNARGSE
ncbi:hypothetical protein GOP47_0025540 [Adiantum capillus-veneris]|uniref:tRNA synthetases class I catalytic domain-containing protein n=1 Tax=Adiantum capillus-veneris TaxID=13818 RepID=A0A9D4U2Y1_ADICA|nr:hypothetical protein GOP47_0025540 [Adiantum capillus-veneris]